MATAYASHASATAETGSGTSELTISKPSNLADGDALVAILAARGDGGDWNTPSGWTKSASVGEGTGDYNLTVLTKKADSSDAGATDFTFSHSDDANSDELQGVLMRVTGNSFPGTISSAIDADADGGSNSGGTVTFSGGVTPTGPNTLLIFSVVSDVNNQNISSYAVATDNPTWSERYENSYTPSALTNHLAVATAPRSEQTATGDYSANFSDGDSFIGALISITESVDVTVNAGVLSAASTLQSTTQSGGANVSAGVMSASSSLNGVTLSTTTDPWSNQSRSTGTWTNQSR